MSSALHGIKDNPRDSFCLFARNGLAVMAAGRGNSVKTYLALVPYIDNYIGNGLTSWGIYLDI
jgi:hypothetical protein